jgi:hypothetical protein
MPDHNLGATSRKRALIAPLVILAVLAAVIVGAIGVHAVRERKTAALAVPAPAPSPTVSLSLPEPPLSRADIVQDAVASASAYAASASPPLQRSALLGRHFVVRIPFGCGGLGVTAPTAQASVELDTATNSLKLTAQPSIWTSLPVLQDLPNAARIETVEGFWIPRPWITSETCPPVRDTPLPATPTPASAQTVGLARLFEKGGSRVLMRGDKPYQTSVKLPKDDAELLSHTYRLVLEGKIVGYGDGRAAHCWSETADHRPICLFAVTYERVAFEDGKTGATLAEWRD